MTPWLLLLQQRRNKTMFGKDTESYGSTIAIKYHKIWFGWVFLCEDRDKGLFKTTIQHPLSLFWGEIFFWNMSFDHKRFIFHNTWRRVHDELRILYLRPSFLIWPSSCEQSVDMNPALYRVWPDTWQTCFVHTAHSGYSNLLGIHYLYNHYD